MEKVLAGYVGFSTLPNQAFKKAVKKSFVFNLMVVGASGLGKSTLINSLFISDIYKGVAYPHPNLRSPPKTAEIQSSTFDLIENNVSLSLTLIDTPGFGDHVDNYACWKSIVSYIDDKFEQYFMAESAVERFLLYDNRVHCCLYFISPNSHGLKSLDIRFMKELHNKVNIVPIIAKADTLTSEESIIYKKKILEDILREKIKIYNFPDASAHLKLSEASKISNVTQIHAGDKEHIRYSLPYGVVGSNVLIEIDGKKIRGRQYPWGVVDIDNIEHCDFSLLRDVIVRKNMQDLKDVVHNILYENFRLAKFKGKNVENLHLEQPFANLNVIRTENLKKIELEMQHALNSKLHELENKHMELIDDLSKKTQGMKESLDQERLEIKHKRIEFEEDKNNFGQEQGAFVRSVSESGRTVSLPSKSKKKRS